MNRNKKPSN